MAIGDLIQHLIGSSVTATVIYGLVLLSVVDFVTGVAKALSVPGDGVAGTSFKLLYFDAWVKTKATKLINVIFVLIAGAAAPSLSVLGLDVNPLTTLGVGWAATVAASLVGSITANVQPSNKVAVPQEVVTPGVG